MMWWHGHLRYWDTPDIRRLVFHAAVTADMALLFVLTTIPGVWNLHGSWTPGWPLPVDLALFGGLYYLLFRPSRQEFLTKAGLLAIGGAVYGYLILPNLREVVDRNKIALTVGYAVIELLGRATDNREC